MSEAEDKVVQWAKQILVSRSWSGPDQGGPSEPEVQAATALLASMQARPYKEVRGKLVHERFYSVWSQRECDDGHEAHCWRTAWWDNENNFFFDQDGEELVLDTLQVMTSPLPDMSDHP